MSDIDEIRLEQAKKVETETLWDCHECAKSDRAGLYTVRKRREKPLLFWKRT